MDYTVYSQCMGLDMVATGARIGKLIDDSGLNDRKLSEMMNLSVQSVNKWRHGRCIPDIENILILSRILGKTIDEFLVPLSAENIIVETKPDTGTDFDSMLCRLKEYMIHFKR